MRDGGDTPAAALRQLMAEGMRRHGEGDVTMARALYQQVLEADPAHPDALHLLGMMDGAAGRPEEGLSRVRQALAASPGRTAFQVTLGRLLQQIGDTAAAADAYGEVLTADPNNVPALFSLGNLRQSQGQLKEAQALYRCVAAADASHAPARNNLGAILLETGDAEAAVALLREAAKRDPDHDAVHANLALALERAGDPAAGAEVLAQRLSRRPDDAPLWRHLALLRYHLGDLEGAATALWRALSLDPDMAGAHRLLLVLLQAAQYRKACSPAAPGQWIARLRELAPRLPLPEILAFDLAGHSAQDASSHWRAAAARLGRPTPSFPPPGDVGKDRWAVLLNFGRSGTGFLHALMDDHPQVTTLPGIYFKDFFDPHNWGEIRDPDPRVMVARFCERYAVLFDARRPRNVPGNNHPASFPIGVSEGFTTMGEDQRRHLSLDEGAFTARLTALLDRLPSVDALSFFRAVHAAADGAAGRTAAPDLYFYHIHNPDPLTFVNFLRQAPDCRIVMIVREPLQSLESWIAKSMDTPGDYPEIVGKVVRMLCGLNRSEFGLFPSAGVRLEDVKAQPDETLSALCRFLGIAPAPSLKTPTMQGLRWWGEPGSVRLSAAGAFGRQPDDPTDRKVGAVFSDQDQLLLRTLFHPFSRRFGYPAETPEEFAGALQRIRPLLDRPFDFERRYAETHPAGMLPLSQNLHCAYLRRILILRWQTLMDHGDYPGTLDPLSGT